MHQWNDTSINFFVVIYAWKQLSVYGGYFVCCTILGHKLQDHHKRHFHKPNLVNNKPIDYKNKEVKYMMSPLLSKGHFEATNVGFHSAWRALKMLFDGWLEGTNCSNQTLQQTQRFIWSQTTKCKCVGGASPGKISI